MMHPADEQSNVCAQISNPAAQIDLELRFGKSSLLWGKPSASQADSDADICAVSDLPSNVEVDPCCN